MEEAFEKLRLQGKNNVDNVVQWMKDAKILNDQITDERLRKLFEVDRQAKIDLEKFKEVVAKVAIEQKKNVEELHRVLSESSVSYLEALKSGVSAFQETLKKK